MTNRALISGVFLGALMGLAWLYFNGHPVSVSARASPLASTTVTDVRSPKSAEFWKSEIQRIGSKAAYASIPQMVADMTLSQRHQVAHAFGGALYTVEGEKGISVCDAQYSFGCFHEFLGHAIVEEGPASIPRLNDLCWSTVGANGLSCQHGIGHGVMASELYSLDGIRSALGVCAELPRTDPIGGCYGGVFMEYYLQTMLGEKARVHEGAINSAYETCEGVDASFLDACAFWTPQWWRVALFPPESGGPHYQDKNILKVFAQLGATCERWKNPHLTLRTCFEGIGNIVGINADNKPKRILELCAQTSTNHEHAQWCALRGASNLASDVSKSAARDLCGRMAQADSVECLALIARGQSSSAPEVQ